MNSDTALFYLKPYPWDPHGLKLLAQVTLKGMALSQMGQSPTEKPPERVCYFRTVDLNTHVWVRSFSNSANQSIFSRLMPEPCSGTALSRSGWIGLPWTASWNNIIFFSPGALQVTWTFCQILTNGFAYLLASISACKVFKVVANPNNCIWQPKRQQWAQCCLWSSSSQGQNCVYWISRPF